MKQFFKKHLREIYVVIFLLFFIILKLPQLSLPYFWDELGVYARSSLYLHDHQLSLMPSACPPELSRGHPLLFSFIHGLSFELFGDHPITGHITSLVISISFLLVIYYFIKKYFNPIAGQYSILFLAFQPVFYTQSVLVLPEITLALFCLLSVFFWVDKKYFWFGLFSTLAIMTKETAIILPFVLITGNLLITIFSRQKIKIKKRHLILFVPLFVYGIFLLIQKNQNGWYLFPLHESSITVDPARILNFLADYTSFVFIEQNRFIASAVLILFIGGLIVTKRKFPNHPTLIYLIILIIGGLLFSALNFYMERYTIFILAAFSILIGIMASMLESIHKGFRLLFVILCFVSYGAINKTNFEYDVNMGYVTYVETQKQATAYTIENMSEGNSLFANFPLIYGLRDSRFGYGDTTQIQFEIVSKEEIESADYFLIANPGAYDHPMPPADSLQEVKVFSNNAVHINLMERIIPGP